jgi:hypothetical protein
LNSDCPGFVSSINSIRVTHVFEIQINPSDKLKRMDSPLISRKVVKLPSPRPSPSGKGEIPNVFSWFPVSQRAHEELPQILLEILAGLEDPI